MERRTPHPLPAPQFIPEARHFKAGLVMKHALHIAPQDAKSADADGLFKHAKDRARDHIRKAGAHEPLASTPPNAATQHVLVGRTHQTVMHQTQVGMGVAARMPAQLARAVKVDAVPHDRFDEAADLTEARAAVEFELAGDHFVDDEFFDAGRSFRSENFSAGRAQTGIRIEHRKQRLYIARTERHVPEAQDRDKRRSGPGLWIRSESSHSQPDLPWRSPPLRMDSQPA